MLGLRENIEIKTITKKHFEEALKKVRPSVTPTTMEVYKKMEEQYLKSAKTALSPNTYFG